MSNIDQVMQRANKLDDIANDAADLKDNAAEFYDNTQELKKQMLCKKAGAIAGITIGALAVIAAIVVPIVLKYT